jgi:Kef-type K+ transport system membrane component KefB
MFAAGTAIGLLLGFTQTQSLFTGVFLMFSSTAVVVKMLSDKDQITSLPGRLNVSILLLQDIVVVLALAALNTSASSVPALGLKVVETVAFIALTAAISVISSRYLLSRLFDSYAEEKHGFLIYAVAWLFIFIQISQFLNLSVEIGAFLAGIGLGRLKISGEVMERIRPLTDVFMAVFFIGVGLKLTQGAIISYWDEALIVSALVIPLKFVTSFLLADYSKFSPETSFIAGANTAQISEFSIVLATLAATQGFITQEFVGFASLTAITTMTVSSYMLNYNKELYSYFEDFLTRFEGEDKNDVDVRRLKGHAVVIGYDRLSKNLLPMLEEYFDDVLIIDSNSENVQELAQSGYEYIYGDFKHGEIRNSAKLRKAGLVLSVSSQHEVNLQVLDDVGDDVISFVRAESPEEALELYELGAHYVIRKNILTGEKLSNYINLHREDKKLFNREVKEEIEKIRWKNR